MSGLAGAFLKIRSGKRATVSVDGKRGGKVYAHIWFDDDVAEDDFGNRVKDSGEWQVLVSDSPDFVGGKQFGREDFRYADPRMRNSVASMAAKWTERLLARAALRVANSLILRPYVEADMNNKKVAQELVKLARGLTAREDDEFWALGDVVKRYGKDLDVGAENAGDAMELIYGPEETPSGVHVDLKNIIRDADKLVPALRRMSAMAKKALREI